MLVPLVNIILKINAVLDVSGLVKIVAEKVEEDVMELCPWQEDVKCFFCVHDDSKPPVLNCLYRLSELGEDGPELVNEMTSCPRAGCQGPE